MSQPNLALPVLNPLDFGRVRSLLLALLAVLAFVAPGVLEGFNVDAVAHGLVVGVDAVNELAGLALGAWAYAHRVAPNFRLSFLAPFRSQGVLAVIGPFVAAVLALLSAFGFAVG